jgi:hypothetical protein
LIRNQPVNTPKNLVSKKCKQDCYTGYLLANPLRQEYNLSKSVRRRSVPVSKKRKKKRSSPVAGPPPPRAEVTTRKKKLSKQQIALYVFSVLIILSLALSFIIGNNTPAVPPDVSTGQGVIAPTATPGADTEENEQEGGDEAAPSEATSEPTPATE